jgi:hypothetical protein
MEYNVFWKERPRKVLLFVLFEGFKKFNWKCGNRQIALAKLPR